MARLRIREVAEAQKMNMSRLSRRTDISIVTIRKMWRNPDYNPSLATLQKIADVLGVSIKDLIEDNVTNSSVASS